MEVKLDVKDLFYQLLKVKRQYLDFLYSIYFKHKLKM